MLQARLGRRINELCMLDHDPLSMLGHPSGDQEPGAFVARLRYQQTKIGGAPDTILVDAEIVAIIRAQQDWPPGISPPRVARPHAPLPVPRLDDEPQR